MPVRAGVDDDRTLTAAIDVWRAGQADLDRRVRQVEERITRLLAVQSPTGYELGRLQAQVARIRGLEQVTINEANAAAGAVRTWLDGGGMARVYAAGGGVVTPSFQWSVPHRAAVEVLADDLYSDVLRATTYMETDAKRIIRRLGKRTAALGLTGGTTARQSGDRLTKALSAEFGKLGTVRYKNGSRHGFGEYGQMLMRSKTAVAYNLGTLAESQRLGIRLFEIFDSPECGLTAHNDPVKANGLIAPLEVVMQWPTSHNNCVRALGPRPDATAATTPDVVAVNPNRDPVMVKALKAAEPPAATGRGRPAREGRERRSRPNRVRPGRPTRVQAVQASTDRDFRRRQAAERARAGG